MNPAPPAPWLRTLALGLLCLSLAILAGCASRSGGYYQDDGPGDDIPEDIASIPNATPRIEHHRPANFRPYEVFGVRYTPIPENQPYRQEGIASWYGKKFHGEKTANGETYDMYAMTAAHPTLPLPSYARVTRVSNGRSVIVRINDRGPFHSSRIIDLSYVAAAKLGLIGPGSGRVIVQAITNDDIRAGRYPGTPLSASAAPVTPPPASAPTTPPTSVPVHHDTPTASLGTGGIFLQFGAFSSSDNAHALASRINQYAAELGTAAAISYQAPLYKVRMGPYASRAEADQMASHAFGTTGLNPVIALDRGL